MNQAEKQQILDYIDKFSAVFNDMMQEVTRRVVTQSTDTVLDGEALSELSAADVVGSVKIDTKKFIDQQLDFLGKQQQLWQNAAKAFLGQHFDPVVEAARDDKRFDDGDWSGNPAFNYIKQAYLLNAEYMNQLVAAMEFEDKKVEQQVRFYTRQFVNSVAPSNYVFTNPEVCREILSSQGENLARGIDNFMRDLEHSPNEAFKITQVAKHAFTLGRDLATTPGSVIFQNALIQLIHYRPTTAQVHAVPMLIVPPFINKFYILDLNEKKSLVKWLLDQGFSVFMISWVNPDADFRDVGLDDYVTQGVVAALDVVAALSGQANIHATGYCVGGTLLGMTQSYLQQRGDTRLHTLTLLTTLFDFSEPGEVATYLSRHLLPLVEQSALNKGYFDGRVLALSFSLLRENNLFWSFFIEHYLKGKDPVPFDILYWNSDSTNLPARAFLYYLRNMYMDNALICPGKLNVKGYPVDLSRIHLPVYCLAAQADHIVLWQAAYKSARVLGGEVRFVLTESGHVAGVVNPADKGKYPHWVNPSLPASAAEWLAGATQVSGSWWNDWLAWLQPRSGGSCPALPPGEHPRFPECEAAPGAYVRRRLDDD